MMQVALSHQSVGRNSNVAVAGQKLLAIAITQAVNGRGQIALTGPEVYGLDPAGITARHYVHQARASHRAGHAHKGRYPRLQIGKARQRFVAVGGAFAVTHKNVFVRFVKMRAQIIRNDLGIGGAGDVLQLKIFAFDLMGRFQVLQRFMKWLGSSKTVAKKSWQYQYRQIGMQRRDGGGSSSAGWLAQVVTAGRPRAAIGVFALQNGAETPRQIRGARTLAF